MQVLLLDEITVDLDVLARADLLEFLREESEERRATIVYVRLLRHWPADAMHACRITGRLVENLSHPMHVACRRRTSSTAWNSGPRTSCSSRGAG